MDVSEQMFGRLTITPQLEDRHAAYLHQFHRTRRMKRDVKILAREDRPDPLRLAVGLPLGVQGGYFVGVEPGAPQTADIVDGNVPPWGQPTYNSLWRPTPDGRSLVAERYDAEYRAAWLRYMLKHFLGPWGYTVSGAIGWEGERLWGGPFCRLLRVINNHATVRVVGRYRIYALDDPPAPTNAEATVPC